MVTHSGAVLRAPAPHLPDELPRLAGQCLLDLGWESLTAEGPAVAGLVLAHPEFGIALLDLGAARVADPVARLRLRLAHAGFDAAFAGGLPVIHRWLAPEDLWRLPLVLDHAFASEPPPGFAGRDWIDGLRRALMTPAAESPAVAPEPEAAHPDLHTLELPVVEPAVVGPAGTGGARRAPALLDVARFLGLAILLAGAGVGVLRYLAPGGAPQAAMSGPVVAALSEPAPLEPAGELAMAPADAAPREATPVTSTDLPVAAADAPVALVMDRSATEGAAPPSGPEAARPDALALPATAEAEPLPEPETARLDSGSLPATAATDPLPEPEAALPERPAPPATAEIDPLPEPEAARFEPLAQPATTEVETAGPAMPAAPATAGTDPLPEPEALRPGPIAAEPPAVPAPQATAPNPPPPPVAAAEPVPAAPAATAAAPPAPPPAALSPALVAALLARGNRMLEQGDISAARLLFGRAAAAGSAAAALALARTYDAAVLAGLGARGIRPDAEQAASWYRRAAELEADARRRP